jgi:hypothetical protein
VGLAPTLERTAGRRPRLLLFDQAVQMEALAPQVGEGNVGASKSSGTSY